MMQTIFINEGDVNSEAHSLLLRRKTMRRREKYEFLEDLIFLLKYLAGRAH
jgi:hypothetical protein